MPDGTIEVRTKDPHAPLLATSASHYGLRIFPKELLQGDLLKTTPIGTGPFILENYQQSNKAEYRANPDYFKQGLPYLQKVTINIMPEARSAYSAFETGQVNVITGVDCVSADNIRQAKKDANYAQLGGSLGGGGYFAVNTTSDKLKDPRVRRALSMAFNRQAENEALNCGGGDVDRLIPYGGWGGGLTADQLGEASKYWQYNPDEAKKLLAAAGFGEGFEVEAVYTPQYGQIGQESLERAVADFARIGVTAKPVTVQYNEWISSKYRPPFDHSGILWGPNIAWVYVDPDPYVWYWLHPDPKEGISNQSRVNDPEITPLLVKQRQTLDRNERGEVLKQIQLKAADQQYYISRTTNNIYTIWDDWLQGWNGTNSNDQTPLLETAWDSRL